MFIGLYTTAQKTTQANMPAEILIVFLIPKCFINFCNTGPIHREPTPLPEEVIPLAKERRFEKYCPRMTTDGK